MSIGSKIMWLKNDYSKAPKLDTEGKPVVDKLTGDPIGAGFMKAPWVPSLKPIPKVPGCGSMTALKT